MKTIQNQSSTVFTDKKLLVKDLRKWNTLIYVSVIQSTILKQTPIREGYVLATHCQSHFNKVSTTYCVGGITFLATYKDETFAVFNLSQPIKQVTRIDYSDREARYFFELENCDEVITMLAINR